MTPLRLAALGLVVAVVCAVAFTRNGFMRVDAPDAVPRDRWHGLLDVLLLAAAIAIAVGLIEVGLIAFRQGVQGKFAFWRLNAPWLTPVAYLFLFAVPATVLAVLTLAKPRWVPIQAVVFVLLLVAGWSVCLSFPRLHKLAAAALALGFATRMAYFTAGHAPAVRRLSRWGLPALLGLVGILFLATTATETMRERRRVAATPAPGPEAPNVVLLFLDTVRAASLSLYGYERPTTVNLEELARESVVFDWVISSAPWTLPGHASAFTGRFSHEAGVGNRSPLDDEHPTLAETLLAHGYRTAGFVANRRYCGSETGLARGFAHYEDYLGTREPLLGHALLGQIQGVQRLSRARTFREHLRAIAGFGPSMIDDQRHLPNRSVEDINRDFLSWLDREGTDRPFLAFLNYMDAHAPYEAPPRIMDSFDDGTVLPPKGRYDGAIAYIDQEIDRLVRELDRRGLMERTLFVVTSDHGEHFKEDSKDLQGHRNSLYTQVLRVPLLIRYPGRVPAGVRVSTVVSLADLAVTVLELAGVPNDLEIPGRSLESSWRVGENRGVALSELTLEPEGPPDFLYGPTPHMKSLMGNRYHYYWEWLEEDGGLREVESLFDIRADPAEERDLAGLPEGEMALARLRAELRDRFPADLVTAGR